MTRAGLRVSRGAFEIQNNNQQSQVQGQGANFRGSIAFAIMTTSPAVLASFTGPTCCLYCKVGERGFVSSRRRMKQDGDKGPHCSYAISLECLPSPSRPICKMWIVTPALCTCQGQQEAYTMYLKVSTTKPKKLSGSTFLSVLKGLSTQLQ